MTFLMSPLITQFEGQLIFKEEFIENVENIRTDMVMKIYNLNIDKHQIYERLRKFLECHKINMIFLGCGTLNPTELLKKYQLVRHVFSMVATYSIKYKLLWNIPWENVGY